MSGFDQALKNRVRERDMDCCGKCGRHVPRGMGSVHHRLPRSRGGRNVMANLALLCGHAVEPASCHYFTESNRHHAYSIGWLLKTGQDPATTPVRRSDGSWWLLGESWEPAEPPVSPDLALHVEDEEVTR